MIQVLEGDNAGPGSDNAGPGSKTVTSRSGNIGHRSNHFSCSEGIIYVPGLDHASPVSCICQPDLM